MCATDFNLIVWWPVLALTSKEQAGSRLPGALMVPTQRLTFMCQMRLDLKLSGTYLPLALFVMNSVV